MIKAVIFDCFGVLTFDLWIEFVSSLPDEQKKPVSDINHSYDRGEISESEFLQRIQKLTGKTPEEVEKVRNIDSTKNTQLLAYIATNLKSKYKVGLLSNIASNWIRQSLLTSEEQLLFNDMVFSFEVGMTKPDPAIFQLTAKRLGVVLSECVFIDDIEFYCRSAQQIGMQVVVYKNFEQTKQELEVLLAKG